MDENRKKKTVIIILLELAGIMFLWLFVNSNYINLIPKCWIYEHTGFLCPSCGGTRCVQNIMKGNLVEAFQSHIVFFIILVYLISINIIYLINLNRKHKILTWLYPKLWHVIIFVIILIVYTIIRNWL